MLNKIFIPALISCLSMLSMEGSWNTDDLKDLYHSEWHFCMPGESTPTQQAQKLATLIEEYTNPAKKSRPDFVKFKQQLTRVLKSGKVDLKTVIDIPGIRNGYLVYWHNYHKTYQETNRPHSGSINDWIESDLAKYNPKQDHSLHQGDIIRRLQEVKEIFNIPVGFKEHTTASLNPVKSPYRVSFIITCIGVGIWLYCKDSKKKKTE